MRTRRSRRSLRGVHAVVLMLTALGAVSLLADVGAAADPELPYAVSVENGTAKVGEKTVIVARITVREGFAITDAYRHRIMRLSASDGLALGSEVVRGSIENDAIVFRVGLTPTKAGTHSVTGVFRFSFHNDRQLEIRLAPFEATVTATE